MKKVIIFLAIILVLLIIGFFTYDHVINHDKIEFKKEFESYNNKNYKNEKEIVKYINVSIDKNNNIEYLSDDNILDEISKDSKIIFFGSPDSNDSRILIPELIKQTMDNGIEKIYYYNINNLEKLYEKKDKNAEKTYEELVKIIDNHINKTFDSGNKKGKKKINNPTVIVINKGKIKSYHEGSVPDVDDNNSLSNDEKKKLSEICENIALDLIMCNDDC